MVSNICYLNCPPNTNDHIGAPSPCGDQMTLETYRQTLSSVEDAVVFLRHKISLVIVKGSMQSTKLIT